MLVKLRNFWGILFFYGGMFHLIRLFNNILGKRLTVLTYHRVTDKNIEQIESSLPYLFVNLKTFEKQLQFLKKHYKIINFKSLRSHIESNAVPWNSLIITFDDGYEDNYHKTYPILKKYNISASIFLVANKIGNNNLNPFWWDRAYYYFNELQKMEKAGTLPALDMEVLSIFERYKNNPSKLFAQLNRWETKEIEKLLNIIQVKAGMNNEKLIQENKMLDWQQIIEMNKDMEIGSHTCNHTNLTELEQDQKNYEITESKKIIEKIIKKKVMAFSYPAGNMDKNIKTLVKRTGYEFAVTNNSGANDLSDQYAFKRINIWEETSLSLNGNFSKGFFVFKLLGF